MSAIVRALNLSKNYGQQPVVRGLDLDIAPGSCFGLLGPNGAGKTTIIRMLQGITPISAGRLELFGLPMPAAGAVVRRRMGLVPQNDNLDPDFTVADNLRIYARYFGLRGASVTRRIEELLAFVELQDKAGSAVDKLSGGMKRRLTIARALVNDPELVVLDEPTTGLDPQVRHMIWSRLRALRQQGKTLLLTTHYMEEAQRLCDELVILDQGRILVRGSPKALIQQHVEAEVLEISGEGVATRLAAVLAEPDMVALRQETVGDMVFCYGQGLRPLVERLEGLPDLSITHRPGNLEDVFLKLTGRDLRE